MQGAALSCPSPPARGPRQEVSTSMERCFHSSALFQSRNSHGEYPHYGSPILLVEGGRHAIPSSKPSGLPTRRLRGSGSRRDRAISDVARPGLIHSFASCSSRADSQLRLSSLCRGRLCPAHLPLRGVLVKWSPLPWSVPGGGVVVGSAQPRGRGTYWGWRRTRGTRRLLGSARGGRGRCWGERG